MVEITLILIVTLNIRDANYSQFDTPSILLIDFNEKLSDILVYKSDQSCKRINRAYVFHYKLWYKILLSVEDFSWSTFQISAL